MAHPSEAQTQHTPPVIWSVAGSDSSGGAGIQADIKTAHDFAVHGATIITAITAQNSLGVSHLDVVSEQSFTQQLASLTEDIPPKVIKVGLLASVAQVNTLATLILKFWDTGSGLQPRPFVVLDPVQVASTGDVMAGKEVTEAIKNTLLPLVDLLTPNLVELAVLSGIACEDLSGQKLAVDFLINKGCKGILVKGGHGNSQYAIDKYYGPERSFSMGSLRQNSLHTHGTGCTLASAISAAIAKGYLLDDALVIAKAYINQGIRLSYPLGQGTGPVAHGGWPEQAADFPYITTTEDLTPKEHEEQLGFLPCNKQWLGLYPVVPNVKWLTLLLQAGVKTIQLRVKDPAAKDLESQVYEAVALGRAYQAQVFINDYWQLAIKYQAYGVHLGQEDLLLADLPSIKAAGLRLGISTHGYHELLIAKQLKPTYIALGHIFPTQTKQMPSNPQGLNNLKRHVNLCEGAATVAIGGISEQRVKAVQQTSVDGIAMVSAILQAPNWQAVTKKLLKQLLPTATNNVIEVAQP
ncbi:thiamine phosphate synthase [uncultured Paraglaciecola sp.]|uniref:thiamine phosphate synthase n=1 Tax=uncultured Paraglaciecola sp. TaxID=1765024 RepID=UPI0030D9DEA0|tara:strand:- start:41501 stop:43066 length:1566 start_codon:yes stop_codon:yes gene_type:complete